VSLCGNNSYTKYWQPFQAKQCLTSRLPHHENERQRSVNNLWSCILDNQGIAQICELITELLTTFIGKNTKYKRKNTDSKIINIANCKTCKKRFLDVEYVILIRYYYQTAKTRALYECLDGPAGRPTDNPPYSDGLGDFYQTVPELMFQVNWRPIQQIWKWFGFNSDPDPK